MHDAVWHVYWNITMVNIVFFYIKHSKLVLCPILNKNYSDIIGSIFTFSNSCNILYYNNCLLLKYCCLNIKYEWFSLIYLLNLPFYILYYFI